MEGFCEYSAEPLSLVDIINYSDRLSNYKLFKADPVPWKRFLLLQE
jgi:hypothetical protein